MSNAGKVEATKYTPQYKARHKGEIKIKSALLSGEITPKEAHEQMSRLAEEIDRMQIKTK